MAILNDAIATGVISMKSARDIIVAVTLCAFLLAGNTHAQTEQGPAPAPGPVTPPPGILVTPPRLVPQRPAFGEKAPAESTQPQSCPDTGHKLELVV